MTKVYGGLLFENLIAQDKYFALQLWLFEKGLIQGIQLRAAHPSFTPGAEKNSLQKYISALPDKMELLLHFGAENAGVDFGQNFDERGVYHLAKKKTGIDWQQWNKESVLWGLEVAAAAGKRIPENFPSGVVHPGYAKIWHEDESRRRINEFLKTVLSGNKIALENCPPTVDKKLGVCSDPRFWSRDSYWAVGGIPFEMQELLTILGPNHKCLIDFTHLFVMVNQAENLEISKRTGFNRSEELINEISNYLSLPHWPVCHFSGCPPTLIDNHDYLAIISQPIRDAIKKMEAVCLEIPYYPDDPELNEAIIEMFYEAYLK